MYQRYGFSFCETSGNKERKQEFEIYPVQISVFDFESKLRRLRLGEEINTVYRPCSSNFWSSGRVIIYFEEENKYDIVRSSTNEKKKPFMN